MTQPVALSNRSQVALQSYLDDLLFDATQAEAAGPVPVEPLAEPALEVIDEAPLAMPVELEQVGVPAEALAHPLVEVHRRLDAGGAAGVPGFDLFPGRA